MFGRFLFSSVLLLGVLVAAGWYWGLFPVAGSTDQLPAPAHEPRLQKHVTVASPVTAQMPSAAPDGPKSQAREPIVITNARLAVIKRQDVPSPKEGVLEFVGYPLRPGEDAPKGEPTWTYQGQRFRRLREGDTVQEGQLVAAVDATLAVADLAIKHAKLTAAVADRIASEHTRDEAEQRYQTQVRLKRFGLGATSDEDVRGAHLTWIRYIYEEKSKSEAIRVAEQEKKQALATLEMYEIRPRISGVVQKILRRDGEAVKALDPVLQIQSYDLLRIDGLLDEQHAAYLHQGDTVVLEPTRREPPTHTFKRHRGAINAVAVSSNPDKPLIVSASEDSTAIVWDLATGQLRCILDHNAPVLAVACLPGTAREKKPDWCLTGSADHRARLWNLDDPTAPALELAGHRSPVTAVAFSPDARLCATGGDYGEILLWSSTPMHGGITDATFTDARITDPQPLASGHRPGQAVTELHFTSNTELVSVGRDNTIRVWKLDDNKALPAAAPVQRQSSDVGKIGVSPDGKYILDPHGHVVGVLSLPEGRIVDGFQNYSPASLFRAFARFSPDARLVLTTSSTDGVLQLWRLGQRRSYELRQLNPSTGAPAVCATFDPNGKFIVGGTKDGRVHVWPMPSPTEISQILSATIRSVGRSVQSIDSQVPVMAEFINPKGDGALLVGDAVTMVSRGATVGPGLRSQG
jgi:WD40 repeat protein